MKSDWPGTSASAVPTQADQERGAAQRAVQPLAATIAGEWLRWGVSGGELTALAGNG